MFSLLFTNGDNGVLELIMINNQADSTMTVNKRVRVEVGDLCVSNDPDQMLLTYALGSCLGVAVHDAQNCVGGLAHVQLPTCRNMAPIAEGVWSYADRALPELFQRMFVMGAMKRNLRIVLVGGASVLDPTNFFQIGRKNYLMVKNLLWRSGYFIAAEAVGGTDWRTMRLDVGTGRVEVQTSRGKEIL